MNEEAKKGKQSPIKHNIGATFIPVKNIEAARDWYCDILGLEPDGDILFGHLYVIPLANGNGLVLDSKIYPQRSTGDAPLFHFDTEDIQQSYDFLNEKGVHITSDIEHGHFFHFKDPYGNALMVCQC
ncbi:VOC family protein [Caldalkalibacillus salinus]|uniref:VOC family protein n=1 Tax=Caldalkalibacillus salinus TaxID=2803787 RepID=UPI001923C7C8